MVDSAIFESEALRAQLHRVLEFRDISTANVVGPVRREVISCERVDSARWRTGTIDLDIVVTMFNAEDHVVNCLESIIRVTTVPHRIIIVDDASSLHSHRVVADYIRDKPWITIIQNRQNMGYTKSANLGLSSSQSSWALLLNSDTIVTPGWLEGMLAIAEADDKIALVGPLSNAATWQSIPQRRLENGQWSVNRIPENFTLNSWAGLVTSLSDRAHPEVSLLNGFCLLMRRAAIEAIGLFDEAAFPDAYGEEVDLCVRAKKCGYKIVIADDVFVYHHKSISYGGRRRARLAKRGGIAFRNKHNEVDFEHLENEMSNLAPLENLRQRIIAAVNATS